MYVTEVLTRTKKGAISHRCILLRESYRENGRVKNRTIANLTHCKPEEVAAMKLALKHAGNLGDLKSIEECLSINQGPSVGAAWLIYRTAALLGIEKALGTERQAKLALWQVIARVIDQGSRLSAVRLAQTHAACDILGMKKGFNEDHLYDNLAWLAENQLLIEKRLLKNRNGGKKPKLFLYDVTSSYLEGELNELGAYGYNRDGKKGKKQLVIGLLCDDEGVPVSVRVFRGNTNDLTTFNEQVEKTKKEFGCERVTFVGDRGMIKSGQIDRIREMGFHYITAITRPQIEKLIRDGVFQMDLFDEEICEVEEDEIRYVLRRNPRRAEEIASARQSKRRTVEKLIRQKNEYLADHPRARTSTSLKDAERKIESLRISGWLRVEARGRKLVIAVDENSLQEESRLDGCYVIKSDLPPAVSARTIHDRYKDLAEVEQAFRTCKTTFLEMRPWYVRCEASTRGHAFVVMMAYLIVRHLKIAWAGFDLTVEEGLNRLSNLCSLEVELENHTSFNRIPEPDPICSELLSKANVFMPGVLPRMKANVVSRKDLAKHRKMS